MTPPPISAQKAMRPGIHSPLPGRAGRGPGSASPVRGPGSRAAAATPARTAGTAAAAVKCAPVAMSREAAMPPRAAPAMPPRLDIAWKPPRMARP
ncbi:hypothetical protein AC230_29000 [Streptomyces caatingaensis]|uniref:Uncharacterized protein n=1 Tax=Streptomyces caatingaensis TaxID=1678637 RepID=A0A0K9X793_9ACTN|nr:hypothetical protein AC230_29000 [Streptomyces caatingaensis]